MAKLFADLREANLRSCVTMVEEVLQGLGYAAADSRIPGRESPGWRVQKGSASVFILLNGRDEENFLRIVAPVVHLDARVDRATLFERLLLLNDGEVYGAAFALDKERGIVNLVCERSTLDLDRSEVLDLVRRVTEYADKYDDILVAEFGGRKAGPSSVPA